MSKQPKSDIIEMKSKIEQAGVPTDLLSADDIKRIYRSMPKR